MKLDGELPHGWFVDDAGAEEVEQEAAVYGPFTESLRELVDLAIRSEVDLEEVREAHAAIERVNERLRARTIPGAYGVRIGQEYGARNWGNAIIGLRNAIAPPLHIETDADGRAWCDFRLGAAYEGPPGLVHGGVTALVLDHVCGAAAGVDRRPRFTGTLTLRYRRETPLGELHAEAHVDRTEGRKTFVVGHLADAEGPTVEVEAIMILPRWAMTPDD